ncbi:MAG: adenylate/guanylate cyclase domain-containing protein [Treponema sp.]|nr:adenylate/guanylate cyclase domain-containing protein [Treponema sp.]
MAKDIKDRRKAIIRSSLLGLFAAAFFSILYLLGAMNALEDRIYDMFLRFRAPRERIGNVTFLDVDDPAIAYNGVFPWPRSITADGLLRLKEYGAKAAVFDIEYIDKGPQGVDSIYLNQGLEQDFDRSFSDIASGAADIFSALRAGRIQSSEIDGPAQSLASFIAQTRDDLLVHAQSVARDNDLYMAQASALYGKSWVTLNLREDKLDGEQAERRPMAEELFSQPVAAPPSVYKQKFVDILPALPVFAKTGKGAGFTNVEIDSDGTRRRIYLAQNIQDHWYFQLAFAPLMDFLGKPEVTLTGSSMLLKGAQLPSGKKDILIPLDGQGRMMLDWPPQDYQDSFRHVSFADFSLLEDLEAEMESYSRALLSADIPFFAQFDNSLADIHFTAIDIANLYDTIREDKNSALENCSDEYFNDYIDARAQCRALIRGILDKDPGARVAKISADFSAQNNPSAAAIDDEAKYIAMISDYLATDLNRYEEVSAHIRDSVQDSFCILGRVDTGTTDIGVNPFWSEYVNVGTHAVVLDTILSESFIRPLGVWWSIIIALAGAVLFLCVTSLLTPILRATLGFLGAAVILAASVLIFRFTGIFFGPLGIVLAILVSAVIREIVSYAGSDKERKFYLKAFATYTSEAVANEIARDPQLLQLGGTRRDMSAIFTDIQGFSTISEKLSPEELVSLLNRYLTAMSNVVLDEQGTIDKYEGDAIIAFFGAPLEQADHALRACVSAVKMKQTEAELNTIIAEQHLSHTPLLTRIGINSGGMVAGNMGTDKKMNYTIMGDAVNLAARLEGVNKQYGTYLLASGDTIAQTGDSLLYRRLDRVRVVGKSEPVQLCNIIALAGEASAEQRNLVTTFNQALDYFEKRDWKKAGAGFKELLLLEGKGPAQVYLKRCTQYITDPPEDAWDGVFNLTEK